MPRKSRAELAVVPRLADHHRRIVAPPECSPEEAKLFREIVEAAPALHFTQSDAPLLRILPSHPPWRIGVCIRATKPERGWGLGESLSNDRHVIHQAETFPAFSIRSKNHRTRHRRSITARIWRELSLAAIRDGDGAGRGWTARR